MSGEQSLSPSPGKSIDPSNYSPDTENKGSPMQNANESFGRSGTVSSPERIPEDAEGENETPEASPSNEPKFESKSESLQSSSRYKEKIQTLRNALQEIKEKIGYEEVSKAPQPSESPYEHTPKFKVSVEPPVKPKPAESKKPQKTVAESQTALLRSIKRLGDTVEREYKIIKRLPIDQTDQDWISLSQTFNRIESRFQPQPLPKVAKGKPCKNCMHLLSRGLATDACKKHKVGTRKK